MCLHGVAQVLSQCYLREYIENLSLVHSPLIFSGTKYVGLKIRKTFSIFQISITKRMPLIILETAAGVNMSCGQHLVNR